MIFYPGQCFAQFDIPLYSQLVHWLALWFCDSQVAGLIPFGDGQAYELFGEIALMNQRFYLLLFYL